MRHLSLDENTLVGAGANAQSSLSTSIGLYSCFYGALGCVIGSQFPANDMIALAENVAIGWLGGSVIGGLTGIQAHMAS